MTLPTGRMYAVRHGVTGRVWSFGLMWLWPSRKALRDTWKAAKECGLVEGELREHNVVIIKLEEVT